MNWLQKIALVTVFNEGSSTYKHFILRKGRLWMWSDDISQEDEQRLVQSLQQEFPDLNPRSKYEARDLFDAGMWFPEEDASFFKYTPDTIRGSIHDGVISARGAGDLPVNSNHPELIKLKKYLNYPVGYPTITGMYWHGMPGTTQRLASVIKYGLLPSSQTWEGNTNYPKAPYDRDLLYLATDPSTALGHATHGGANTFSMDYKIPRYSIVFAIKHIDPSKLELDFDAKRQQYGKLNRAGVLGYRGRIPLSAMDHILIYRNGYNKSTTPLLLTLSSSQFVEVVQDFLRWVESTQEVREEIVKYTEGAPTFRPYINHKDLRALFDKVGDDPIMALHRTSNERKAI